MRRDLDNFGIVYILLGLLLPKTFLSIIVRITVNFSYIASITLFYKQLAYIFKYNEPLKSSPRLGLKATRFLCAFDIYRHTVQVQEKFPISLCLALKTSVELLSLISRGRKFSAKLPQNKRELIQCQFCCAGGKCIIITFLNLYRIGLKLK